MDKTNDSPKTYIEKVKKLNFDCVSPTEMYELIDLQKELPCDKCNALKEIKDKIELTHEFVEKTLGNPKTPNGRGTYCEGSVICKDDDYSTVFVSLFVNGNNGTTLVSLESLQPIMDYIRYVESNGGKAFISGTSYHSDVYYYCVTTIFWK